MPDTPTITATIQSGPPVVYVFLKPATPQVNAYAPVQAATAIRAWTLARNDSDSVFSGFLDLPDELDESDPTYFYFGWLGKGDQWLVRKADRLTGERQDATEVNNPDATTLADAWPDRAALNFSA